MSETPRETLCWRCSAAYPITWPKCPRCYAANANVAPEDAFKQCQHEGELAAAQARIAELEKDAARWNTIESLCAHGNVSITCNDDGRFVVALTDAEEASDFVVEADSPSTAIDATMKKEGPK